MVKFLQSSMGELVNVRWTVATIKSIGAANRRGWRVSTSAVDVLSIHQGTLNESVQENFTHCCRVTSPAEFTPTIFLLYNLQVTKVFVLKHFKSS